MQGLIPLIIIGIVLNMIIKTMRARTQQPPPKRPARPPDLGQDVERPFADTPQPQTSGLGQDVSRPFEDRPRPQVPRIPLAPQTAPRVGDVRPAAEGRDRTKGVSLEGNSLEGTRLETASKVKTDAVTEVRSPVMTGKMTAPNPIAKWFEGNGVVRGIVMSEILNPPVSRRR